MRASFTRICLTVSVLVLLNFFVFVVFPPKNWKLGRIFASRPYGIDISLVRNHTIVYYDLNLKSIDGLTNCQENSELVTGNVTVDIDAAEENYWKISNQKSNNTFPNGTFLGIYKDSWDNQSSYYYTSVFQPIVCSPLRNVAIIIPFRKREPHLRILLGHLVPILRKQQIGYSVFVMEQEGDGTFNKGRLMNSGFEFASAVGRKFGLPYDCFVFQDVDLLVEHDNLLYKCSGGNVVDHLSTSIQKFDYKRLCCGMTVGGVLAMTESQFRKVNGFPNCYWGWGGEDDDINKRIKFRRLKIGRPEEPMGRFTMIKHGPDTGNPYNNDVHKNVRLAIRRCSGGNVVDHLSTSIQKFDYKRLCCGMTVGGVLAMTESQFRKVNGFPNCYWGWGGEDDDINKRIKFRRLKIGRPEEPMGRFTMIKHGPDTGNPYNNDVHKNVRLAIRRLRRDGLNNLRTNVVRIEDYPIFTRVFIDVGKP